jgi:hypothetical protein
MQHIMYGYAFGCALNGCMQLIMHACAFGCGLNDFGSGSAAALREAAVDDGVMS